MSIRVNPVRPIRFGSTPTDKEPLIVGFANMLINAFPPGKKALSLAGVRYPRVELYNDGTDWGVRLTLPKENLAFLPGKYFMILTSKNKVSTNSLSQKSTPDELALALETLIKMNSEKAGHQFV
jgi:hypothetical protein